MKIGRVGAVLLVLAVVAGTGLALAEEGAKDKEASKNEKRQAHHAEMIKKYDKDGDGELSKEEKSAAKDAWRVKRYDKDGDGKLSETERAAADEAKKKFMAKHDKDGDGKLSDEERKAMKKSFREKSKDTDGEK